ncbi:ESX secretion-associated protein EspG [Mycobacterium servetii]|uniref:ESX secretion-associated protein EspG n=1 Tax=Mycobacterium servetii TaxID=3237418 RepID=A0ABV4C959_9MYCO
MQLTAAEAARIADTAPGHATDRLIEHGLDAHDAAILNASSKPDVVTEITAMRRVDDVTRRTKTAVSLLDTENYGRVLAWPHVGVDRQTHLTYAPMSNQRLDGALRALWGSLDDR